MDYCKLDKQLFIQLQISKLNSLPYEQIQKSYVKTFKIKGLENIHMTTFLKSLVIAAVSQISSVDFHTI